MDRCMLVRIPKKYYAKKFDFLKIDVIYCKRISGELTYLGVILAVSF